jgi:hypothetical protein
VNDREFRVKNCEIYVREATLKLTEAEHAFERGSEIAAAEAADKAAKLQLAVQLAKTQLDREKSTLDLAKAELDRGFDA